MKKLPQGSIKINFLKIPKRFERHIKIVPSSDGTKTYIIIKNRVVILWFMYSFVADLCIILMALSGLVWIIWSNL